MNTFVLISEFQYNKDNPAGGFALPVFYTETQNQWVRLSIESAELGVGVCHKPDVADEFATYESAFAKCKEIGNGFKPISKKRALREFGTTNFQVRKEDRGFR